MLSTPAAHVIMFLKMVNTVSVSLVLGLRRRLSLGLRLRFKMGIALALG